jgi:hypothetical protein
MGEVMLASLQSAKDILDRVRGRWTGGWRKLRKEELRDFYPSPSIIRMIKSRRMRLVGHVARMWENKNVYGILMGTPEGK